MADEETNEVSAESEGIQIEPRYLIQSLQNKVAQLTNEVSMMEALASQQQAQMAELAEALSQAQMALAAQAQPEHQGRVTPKKKARTPSTS